MNDHVGALVLIGRVAIDDDQLRALALGHADLLAERLAPGLQRLAAGNGGATVLVDLEQLGRLAVHAAQPVMKKIYAAQKEGKLARKLPLQQLIAKAAELNVISEAEATQLNEMNELRFDAISVDSFKPGELEAMAIKG